MKTLSLFLVLPVCLALTAGCVLPRIQNLSEHQLRSNVSTERDDFKKITTLRGTRLAIDGIGLQYYQLVAIKRDLANLPTLSVHLRTSRTTWAFWGQAYDQDGKSFSTSRSAVVNYGGSVTEYCTIHTPREWLDRGKDVELQIQVYGDGVKQLIVLPPNYVRSFLDRVDESF